MSSRFKNAADRPAVHSVKRRPEECRERRERHADTNPDRSRGEAALLPLLQFPTELLQDLTRLLVVLQRRLDQC